MIDLTVFIPVSMRGRMAYAILCTETYLLARYPEQDWRPLVQRLWTATTERYIDEWWENYVEILPECLLEFPSYEDYKQAENEDLKLEPEEYEQLKALYEEIGVAEPPPDETPNPAKRMLEEIYLLVSNQLYTRLRPESGLEELGAICHLLEQEGIPLPDPALVAFSRSEPHDGWGDCFDGTKLSQILGC